MPLFWAAIKKKAQFVEVTELFSTQLFCSYKSTLSRSLPHTYLRGPTPPVPAVNLQKGKDQLFKSAE